MAEYDNAVSEIRAAIDDAEPRLADAERIIALLKSAGVSTAQAETKARDIKTQIANWKKTLATA